MKPVSRRLLNLERRLRGGGDPIVVFTYGGIAPVIPEDIGDRDVLVWRTVIVEPPVRDAAGNILEPARDWDDDDPRYREMGTARLSKETN